MVLGAATGVLALSGVQGLSCQPRTDTAWSAPRAVAQQDTSKATYDSSKAAKKNKKKGHQTGARSDTAMKVKPGTQTGPTDSMKMQRSGQSGADSTR